MPPDSKAAFKAEWEALEVGLYFLTFSNNFWVFFEYFFDLTSHFKVTEHTWALKNSDQEMMSLVEPTPEHLYHHLLWVQAQWQPQYLPVQANRVDLGGPKWHKLGI